MKNLEQVISHYFHFTLTTVLCFGIFCLQGMAATPESDDIFQKLFKAGRLQRCIEISASEPNSFKSQSERAASNFLRRHFNEAISDISKFLSSAESNQLDNVSKAGLLALRGACYYEIGSFDEALEDFNNAAKMIPECPPEIAKSRAQIYEKLGNNKKASEINYPNVGYSFQDGLLLSKSQSYCVPLLEIPLSTKFPGQGTLGGWQQATKLAKEARNLEAENQLDKAIDKYQAATELYSYDPSLYAALGLCYTTRDENGDNTKSIAAFKKALALDNSSWQIWSDLGSVLIKSNYSPQSGEYENALADSTRAFKTTLSKGKNIDSAQKYDLEDSVITGNKALELRNSGLITK